MKIVFVLLAALALAQAMPTKSLKDDLDDFLALIPREELKALYHKYENDDDVKRVVAYLKSKDFADVMHIIANVPEIQDLVNYLQGKGVPVKEFLNKLADRLGLPHWPGTYSRGIRSARSWRDMLEEAKKLVPVDKIAALALDKLANSPDFQELYEKIANVDYQKLHDNALSHPEIQDMITRLKALGVDISKVWEFVKSIFGWTYKSYSNTFSLKDDLDDFLALIPREELKALYHKYENDEDVKKVVAYLKSKDFADVMHIIANVPEIQDLVNYLQGKGVPVKEFLNRLADRLGLPHWPGTYSRGIRSARSWRDMLEEAKKLVPVDKIAALALDKLANSPDFQELYEKIANVDYQKLHDNALSHPEIQDMITRLKALGVDISKVWEFVKSIFGWTYKSYSNTFSLKDDLDDFLALIPREELKALYHKYENDEDVKKVVAYLKSKDFADVMHIIANVPEIQDLVNYLQGKGVPAKEFLNKLADRLGLPHWPGTYSRGIRSARSWRDMLEEAKQLVPVDKIAALALDKLANSPDFQELYEKIANVDYQKLHDNALSHPEIQDMITRLKALGVDISKVWEFVKSIFGWTYKSYSNTFSLKDDLDDFLALIPREELKALYHKYENDDDVKKVVAYLKSKDFADVMHIIANVPEIQDLVNYLQGKGVPVKEFLNKLADRLGLPHWPGTYSRGIRSARSWRDMLEEAKKLVPVDKIAALALDKLANSPDFQELYEKIANVDYQKLHDNALSHPEIQDMITRLKALGVDTSKVWEFVKSIFGWTYRV